MSSWSISFKVFTHVYMQHVREKANLFRVQEEKYMAPGVYGRSVIKHEGKTGDPYIDPRLRECLFLSFLSAIP